MLHPVLPSVARDCVRRVGVHVPDFEATEFTTTESGKPEREGLPAGYRMRADPHYVELLSASSRGEKSRAEKPRGDASPGRDENATVKLARDRRVFEQLAGDIAAIESASAMLGTETSPLARRVSLDLIKAQAARASWLLRAQALLSGHASELAPNSRSINDVLSQVRDRLAAECRLVGVGLQVTVESRAVVSIDDAVLGLGVSGAILALVGLTTGTENPIIRVEAIVEVDGEEDDLQSIEVSQDGVPLSATMKQRFFDADWVDRPGGWLAAMGAATAQAAADRLGGSVNLATGNRRGCTIRFGFA
jgi:hypothetical protein